MPVPPPPPVDLARFFSPRGVAIIGASANPDRISGRPLRFFKRHGYAGRLYPVNPGRQEIDGLPCYASVEDVPDPVDMAIIAVDAGQVPDAVAACARRGIAFAVIFSGGFGEAGPDGMAHEAALVEVARAGGLRLSGPNCIGSVNLHSGMCATFAICVDREAEAGSIAFVTQSGAFGSAIFGQSVEEGTGIGYFASTGNEADLGFSDYVRHLLREDSVTVVAGYLEGVRDAPAFLAAADEALERGKPLVLLKVGRSQAGERAAASHTGSMTGSDAVYDAVFRQKAILRARDVPELLDMSLLASLTPPPAGRRVAIASISGGANVLMADECADAGLELPPLAPATLEVLGRHIPDYGALHNPVDLTGQFINEPGALTDILVALGDDPSVDAVVLFMSVMYPLEDRIVGGLMEARKRMTKPLVPVWTAGPAGVLQRLRREGLPALADPTRAIRALGAMAQYGARRRALMNGQ